MFAIWSTCGIREIAKRAVRLDRAELIARAFVDDVGDDEIAPVGRQLGKRLDNAEVRISLSQIESAKLLLVGRKPVRIVGVVRLQEAEHAAGLPRVHFLAQPAVGEMRVAEDVDRPDLGEIALVDFEDDIDAVLVELDDLGFDSRRKPALAAIELQDSVNIGTNRATSENLARRELDLRSDLVVLQALVALEDDTVDDRVLADGDDQVAGFAAVDGNVGEQLRRVKIFQRLIERLGRIGLTRRQVRISADRLRLEPLVALDSNRADGPLGGRRRGDRSRRWRRRLAAGAAVTAGCSRAAERLARAKAQQNRRAPFQPEGKHRRAG